MYYQKNVHYLAMLKFFRSKDTRNELQILPGQTEKEPPSGKIEQHAGYKYSHKNIFYQSEANQ